MRRHPAATLGQANMLLNRKARDRDQATGEAFASGKQETKGVSLEGMTPQGRHAATTAFGTFFAFCRPGKAHAVDTPAKQSCNGMESKINSRFSTERKASSMKHNSQFNVRHHSRMLHLPLEFCSKLTKLRPIFSST